MKTRRIAGLYAGILLCSTLLLCACSSQPEVIVITATFTQSGDAQQPGVPPTADSPAAAIQPIAQPTADPTRPVSAQSGYQEHIVRAGDTLFGIASAYNVTIEGLLEVNNLPNPDVLAVGQVIVLPGRPTEETAAFKLIPDSRLVRAPGSASFDVATFIARQSGFITQVVDTVDTRMADGSVRSDRLTATQIVTRVALEYSVDPRILLALLDFKAGWFTRMDVSGDERIYPFGIREYPAGIQRDGLYRQLAWAANELNRGYYGWKYNGWTTLTFADGQRLLFASGLNPGTVGVQHFLSLISGSYAEWLNAVGANGVYQTYLKAFGDPFSAAVDPLVPPDVNQPLLLLPFPAGATWFYTGGHHGGWGSGSGWAAVDFAPPDERPAGTSACYTSQYPVTAVASGVIARSQDGAVVLDLDGDGDESSGWTILYLHIASAGRIPAGTGVQPGDVLGYAACEGGFSNATHVHIARRYNGEWIPIECGQCAPHHQIPPFVLGGWTLHGYAGQEYQGYMSNGTEQRLALEGRTAPDNWISW